MTNRAILPTDMKADRRGSKGTGLPTLRVTRSGRGASGLTDERETAYGVNSLDRLIDAFEERERSLSGEVA